MGRVIRVFYRLRKRIEAAWTLPGTVRPVGRQRNLFEAAATYVAACAENDEQRSSEAARWVAPEALAFGVNELACRAVIALARERDESPHTVARSLLGLPAA